MKGDDMGERYAESSPPGRPELDRAALRATAAMWRQIAAFRARPPKDQARLHHRLGLPDDGVRSVVTLLDRFQELTPPIPEFEAPIGVDDECGFGWHPSVMAPVFWGVRDLAPDVGAPARMRVFFPSTDGSPESAPLLEGCGRYPLVLFLHGSCAEMDHYRSWEVLPAQLARSGYVVVVPDLGGISSPWATPNAELALAEQALYWMFSAWEHRGQLLNPWATAIVGHSYGALIGARLTSRVPHLAYVSLSGAWLEWPWDVGPHPLAAIGTAPLFTWGTGVRERGTAALEGANSARWDAIESSKHKIVFSEGEHWDYIPPHQTTCDNGFRGPCDLVPYLAADFVTMFLSHYLPPEGWSPLSYLIPHSLMPPRWELTNAQKFFIGGHLAGMASIGSATGCSVTHTWRIASSQEGEQTLPAS